MGDALNSGKRNWLHEVDVTEEDRGERHQREASIKLICGLTHIFITCQDSSGGSLMCAV